MKTENKHIRFYLFRFIPSYTALHNANDMVEILCELLYNDKGHLPDRVKNFENNKEL